MRQAERLVRFLQELGVCFDRVLEVACGCAEFSLAAAPVAGAVSCIDLDASRLDPRVREVENIAFLMADAADLPFAAGVFDTVVLYNAAYHLKDSMDAVLRECARVKAREGQLVIASSFKLDAPVLAAWEPVLKQRFASVAACRLAPYRILIAE